MPLLKRFYLLCLLPLVLLACSVSAVDTEGLVIIVKSNQLVGYDEDERKERLRKIVELEYVKGLHLQLTWRDYEPNNGNYQRHLIDDCLEVLEDHGKPLSLAFGHCYFAPHWLFNALSPAAKFKFKHPHPQVGDVEVLVPWNNTYKIHLNDALGDIASHYDGRLAYVTVSGPSTLYGIETNFPLSMLDPVTEGNLNFSLKRFQDEWVEAIDAFDALFPQTALGLTLHNDIGINVHPSNSDIPHYLASHLLSRRSGQKSVIKLAGLTYDTGIWSMDPRKMSNYQKLILPYMRNDDVDVVLEAGQRMIADHNKYDRPMARATMESALWFNPQVVEFYLDDIFDMKESELVRDYLPQFQWFATYGFNMQHITHELMADDTWDDWVGSTEEAVVIDTGLAGSDSGLHFDASDVAYVIEHLDLDVRNQLRFRYRFYFDHRLLDMTKGDVITICRVKNSKDRDIQNVYLSRGRDGFFLSAWVIEGRSSVRILDPVRLDDQENYVEVLLGRPPTAEAGKGFAKVWLNDLALGITNSVNFFTRFDEASTIQLGVCDKRNSDTVSGNLLIDEFRAQGSAFYIGP